VIFVEEHVAHLSDAFEAYNVRVHEDVVLKLFAKSLKGDARQWFRKLPAKSINSWDDLMKVFMGTWDVKVDVKFMLNALYEIKKKKNEAVIEFDLRFPHVLDKILDDMRPNDHVVLYYYMNAFEPHFGYALKEKEPNTLDDAKHKAIRMESHLFGLTN
jgi:hypothetical protein